MGLHICPTQGVSENTSIFPLQNGLRRPPVLEGLNQQSVAHMMASDREIDAPLSRPTAAPWIRRPLMALVGALLDEPAGSLDPVTTTCRSLRGWY